MRRIETVEEGQSNGLVRKVYYEIERLLGVPFVPAFFRALATRPELLASVWDAVRPSVDSQAFTYLSGRIRRQAEALAEATFELVDLYAWMRDHDFDRENTRRVLYALEVFHYVNPRLLLVTGSLKMAFDGIHDPRISRRRASPPSSIEPEFPTAPHRVMMEQAPEIVREGYLDIVEMLRAGIVPDDFQVLGNWPDLLHKAWSEIKPGMHSTTFIEETRALSAFAIELAQELPHAVQHPPLDEETRGVLDAFFDIYCRVGVGTSAIRWMMVEGERFARTTGRAAGERPTEP
jgi:hypothetical protein